MLAIRNDETEVLKDRKVALATSGSSILLFIIIAYFTTFFVKPPLPVDVPPLKSDEVIEEFMIDNVELQEESGGQGGGTPTNDKIAPPTPQSEKYVTQSKSDTKIFNGNSNNNNSHNATNSSSTTQQSTNYFGDGGDGGGSGGGSGGKFGNDSGTGGNGPGGTGNGAGRIRKNNVNVDHIEVSRDETIYLELTIDEDGNVVNARTLSKTTTTDQRIINQVKTAVKSQVKYNKSPGSGLAKVSYTILVNAN